MEQNIEYMPKIYLFETSVSTTDPFVPLEAYQSLLNKEQKMRQLLYKAGICAECEQEVDHCVDEPFSSCDCDNGCLGEDCSGPSTIQKLRMENKQLKEQQEKFHQQGFASIEYSFAREKEALRKKISNLEQEIKLRDKILSEHVKAASIFQPDGKYYKEANLQLGSCCVVEGIKWLSMSMDGYKQKWIDQITISNELRNSIVLLNRENTKLTHDLKYLQESYNNDHIGWKNKWEAAVEMAAIAENKLVEVNQEKDEAIRLRNKWHQCYLDVRGEFMNKIDQVKELCDDLAFKEFDNRRKTV